MKQILFFFSLIFISCCFLSCDPPESFFPDITLQSIICTEDEQSPVSDIYISLRNDSISSDVLAYEITNSQGLAYIVFVEVPDINKSYRNLTYNEYPCENLNSIKEEIQSSDETTKFYFLINDCSSEYYNKNYKTKKVFLNSFNREYYEKIFYLTMNND